jgi:hypothetical protein
MKHLWAPVPKRLLQGLDTKRTVHGD